MLTEIIISFFIITIIIFLLIFIVIKTTKVLGYPKLGKILSVLIIIVLTFFVITEVFRDQLFTKPDALQLLNYQNIDLVDDFEILENKSMISPGDYYHTFSLSISVNDKERIIHQIKNSKEFSLKNDELAYPAKLMRQKKDSTLIKFYKTHSYYIKELFETNKKGYAPLWRKIKIDPVENILIFEDIDL